MPSPKTPFPVTGAGGTMPGRAVPCQSLYTGDKGLQASHPWAGEGPLSSVQIAVTRDFCFSEGVWETSLTACLSPVYHGAGGSRLKAGLGLPGVRGRKPPRISAWLQASFTPGLSLGHNREFAPNIKLLGKAYIVSPAAPTCHSIKFPF